MSPWEKLLERPHSRGHFVQLYDADEMPLVKNVGRYLWEGLKRGDGAVVIVTPAHGKLFLQELGRLGADNRTLLEDRQLVVADAGKTLSRFMVARQPVWHLFEAAANELMRQVVPGRVNAGLRAYGEMVGILWKARHFAAAIRLEQFWNRHLEQSSFSLYCAYAIDLLEKDVPVANLESILCAHTHLMPAQSGGTLETALHLAMDEILGANADALRVSIKANPRGAWAVMPNAEATILWLKKNLPDQAEDIVTRAREHYLRLQPAA